MADEDDDAIHISVSRGAAVSMLGAALAAGMGIATTLRPQADQAAFTACFDNSQTALTNSATALKNAATALDVAGQHGQEFVRLENLLLERTRERYTASDAAKESRKIHDELRLIEKRQSLLEREIDKHHD